MDNTARGIAGGIAVALSLVVGGSVVVGGFVAAVIAAVKGIDFPLVATLVFAGGVVVVPVMTFFVAFFFLIRRRPSIEEK